VSTVQSGSGTGYWTTVSALIATDTVAIAAVTGGMSAAVDLFGATSPWATYGINFAVTLFLLTAYATVGLYRVIDVHPAEELRRIFATTITVGTAASLVALNGAPDQVLHLAALGGVMAVVVPFCSILGRILLSRTDWWGIPAIVLGDGEHGKAVITTLKRWPELGLRPVALLQEEQLGVLTDGLSPDQAPNVARAHRIPYAIIAMPDLSYHERTRMITHFGKFFRRLFVVPEGLGPAALWTSRSSSQGLLGYGVKHFRLSKAARAIKRGIDVMGVLVGSVVLAPLFLAIAALIKLDSRGPVLFKQERMGMDGRCFTVLKFRTMYTDAESKLQDILDDDPELRHQYETYHKLDDDPRVTRVGKWLRPLSLDELPQLWNVLRGEMSLVGPRAYMPGELPKMNGLSRSVLQCPPGLTGLWQVSGRNNLDFTTRVDLDVHYMQNWTVWLDLYILIRTIPVVLSGHGAK
jgi:Undecaprenyl-phosphate galactose phosphotransferase WbaP